mmetsp:Transcript_25511/g.73584  ORF Transcript_25511/g.73584 Transcript_25511/m.73584 type:complete len:244 (-) Transcript_25511:1411-2142(-)
MCTDVVRTSSSPRHTLTALSPEPVRTWPSSAAAWLVCPQLPQAGAVRVEHCRPRLGAERRVLVKVDGATLGPSREEPSLARAELERVGEGNCERLGPAEARHRVLEHRHKLRLLRRREDEVRVAVARRGVDAHHDKAVCKRRHREPAQRGEGHPVGLRPRARLERVERARRDQQGAPPPRPPSGTSTRGPARFLPQTRPCRCLRGSPPRAGSPRAQTRSGETTACPGRGPPRRGTSSRHPRRR